MKRFIIPITMLSLLCSCVDTSNSSSSGTNENPKEIVSQEFCYDDFQIEYYLDDIVDVTTIKVKSTYDDGSISYTNISKNNAKGLDNITSTLGVKTISLTYEDIQDSINVFVYYNENYFSDNSFNEEFRSQFHFSRHFNWVNDPNGLFYNAYTKEYHMYYQAGDRMGENAGNYWSTRYWGHAVSTDLVHWQEQQGYVLYPQNDGFGDIWSGACVIDKDNTTGLFPSYINPEERVVAIYSVTRPQQQFCLAYSLDGGYTFIKYEGNPVIDNSLAQYGGGFRDCKVYWIEDESKENKGVWMIITSGESGMRLFTSDDLIEWKFNSMVNDLYGTPIGNECPMFFSLPVDGNENNIKYVVSPGGTGYYLGTLQKNENGLYRFVCETEKIVFNGGQKHYASQDWTLDSDRVVITSWIQDYYMETNANDTPDRKWEGYLSIPYEAKLKTNEAGQVRLYTYPVSELDILKGEELLYVDDLNVDNSTANVLYGIEDNTFEINLDCNYTSESVGRFGFKVRKSGDEYISIYYDIASKMIVVDQSKVKVAKYIDTMKFIQPSDKRIKMRILVDIGNIDVFVNDGEAAISTIYFQDNDYKEMEMFVEECEVYCSSLSVTHLYSIYNKNGREAK